MLALLDFLTGLASTGLGINDFPGDGHFSILVKCERNERVYIPIGLV